MPQHVTRLSLAHTSPSAVLSAVNRYLFPDLREDMSISITSDEHITLYSGDCILLFTDGVKEALDANDEEYGIERLSETFRQAARLGAEAMVKRVLEKLKSSCGEGKQMNDVTILAIRKW